MSAGRCQGRTASVEVCSQEQQTPYHAGQLQHLLQASNLKHPNIITVYGADIVPAQSSDGSGETAVAHAWLAQEYCYGGPLLQAMVQGLHEVAASDLQSPLVLVLAILIDVARALSAMHEAGVALTASLMDCTQLQVRAAACCLCERCLRLQLNSRANKALDLSWPQQRCPSLGPAEGSLCPPATSSAAAVTSC